MSSMKGDRGEEPYTKMKLKGAFPALASVIEDDLSIQTEYICDNNIPIANPDEVLLFPPNTSIAELEIEDSGEEAGEAWEASSHEDHARAGLTLRKPTFIHRICLQAYGLPTLWEFVQHQKKRTRLPATISLK